MSGRVGASRRGQGGRWNAAYASQSTAQPPPDLVEALAANPAAKAMFGELDAANRYAVIYRVTRAMAQPISIASALLRVRRGALENFDQSPGELSLCALSQAS